jgi:hypothetical protein
MLATITTIAHTSDSRREHRTAGLGAWLQAPFFLMNGSAGYITVTTGLPDPAQFSAHPYIYTRFACAHTDARPRENFVFLKTILDQVKTLHAVAKGENRATFGADEILARDSSCSRRRIGCICHSRRRKCADNSAPRSVRIQARSVAGFEWRQGRAYIPQAPTVFSASRWTVVRSGQGRRPGCVSGLGRRSASPEQWISPITPKRIFAVQSLSHPMRAG